MTINIEKLRADMRWESRKFLVQMLAGFGAAFAGGADALGLILHLIGKI